MARKPREYTDYDKAYGARPEQVRNRMARNRARAQMERKLGEKALEGKDVDHKKALSAGGSDKASNLRVRSRGANRGDKTF